MYRYPEFIQVQTPGSKDIIVFEQRKRHHHKVKSNFHFGFRLQKTEQLASLVKQVEKAGGKIKQAGEFVPGSPYVFLYDPDGYEIEVWFEKIPSTLKAFR